MNFNILVGGAAGQGMETLASILEKVLQRKGFEIFTIRDYMSRVRGGHNFIQIRFSNSKLTSHWERLDGIIALNNETIQLHSKRLNDKGFILCDSELDSKDSRVLAFPFKQIANQLGNEKVSGNIALGVFLKLVDLDLEKVAEVLNSFFQPEISKINLAAVIKGFGLVTPKYETTLAAANETILINGNEAVALGALAAGCQFYSAYPMTPSTSIMNYLAAKMEAAKIVVEQAEDEIAAINMAIGASYAGIRAMTGTSGGGFSLMVEGLGLAAMLEVPLVIAEIQRPGPTTGFPTRTEQADLKFVISAAQGEFPRMVIALKNPEDAFYQTVRAFNIADHYQIPVILLGDQYLADYSTTITPFDFERVKIKRYLSDQDYLGDKEYKRYEITETGVSARIIPGNSHKKTMLADSDEHDEYGKITESAEIRVAMVNKRMRKFALIKEECIEPEFLGQEDCDTLLMAWGSLHGPVKEALSLLNNSSGTTKYGALVFGDIWPLPTKQVTQWAKNKKRIINVEQNATGQLASLIMEATGIACTSSVLKYDGRPLSSQEIVHKLQEGSRQ
jgi:2-oxoglutarate ferredoxin oxidoreductase subunit alpha